MLIAERIRRLHLQGISPKKELDISMSPEARTNQRLKEIEQQIQILEEELPDASEDLEMSQRKSSLLVRKWKMICDRECSAHEKERRSRGTRKTLERNGVS